ncbi:hypothetical protein PUN28_014392 [Cardiocondyla obscurior]|uniref:Uncharacterized protein n=1 Tax=Cardiocondyla obscurior TaxID=286306 RepID=A0AAW2F385_9HYME
MNLLFSALYFGDSLGTPSSLSSKLEATKLNK